jgi:hypothetical protein
MTDEPQGKSAEPERVLFPPNPAVEAEEKESTSSQDPSAEGARQGNQSSGEAPESSAE